MEERTVMRTSGAVGSAAESNRGSSPGAASAQSGFEETCVTKPANPSGEAGIDGNGDERGRSPSRFGKNGDEFTDQPRRSRPAGLN